MLGPALYYPHIDIEDPEWLRTAILFWDELQTIVPRAVEDPYRTRDTKILCKEGFLAPLRCDLHPELLDALGKRVVALMDRDRWSHSRNFEHANDPNVMALLHADKIGATLQEQFHRAHIHPGKLSPELRDLALRAGLARVHPEKLSPNLRHLLDEFEYAHVHVEKLSPHLRNLVHYAERFQDTDGEWLLVDSRFAETYMSALAALLAKETDVAALTNEEPSTPFECFIVCDLTGSARKHFERTIAQNPTPDGEGYYGWSPRHNAHIRVISFKKMLRDAELRNQTFFDQLGLGSPSVKAKQRTARARARRASQSAAAPASQSGS
jgi:hypothetical protein